MKKNTRQIALYSGTIVILGVVFEIITVSIDKIDGFCESKCILVMKVAWVFFLLLFVLSSLSYYASKYHRRENKKRKLND